MLNNYVYIGKSNEMKRIPKLTLLILLAFTFVNCEKEKLEAPDAQILGIDARRCAAPYCGGYWIQMEQDTLRFLNFPNQSVQDEILLNKEFPIAVAVSWDWPEDETLQLAEDLIIVDWIRGK